MTKNRHTFAKRHRELEKKQKADQKRERRAKRREEEETSNAYQQSESRVLLSSDELAVLGVFRKHLMAPGQMFCFGGSDLESFDASLAKLISKGLLIQERFRGGYSLTDKGFAAMKNGA